VFFYYFAVCISREVINMLDFSRDFDVMLPLRKD